MISYRRHSNITEKQQSQKKLLWASGSNRRHWT